MSETPILQLRGISKSFGSVQALTDVDFEARQGEVMALVGDNGAGKSTLIKCVAGIHSPDSGEILFEGKPVVIHSPKEAARLGIEVVYQDLALADNLDVVQNMYLGREERDWLWRLKEPLMEQRTAETLRSLSVTTIRSIRQPVASLSGGQRQSVAVAKAVQWNSKVVILDEPTAALGVAQTRQVLELVKRLADQGLAVVLISHNLIDVFEVATRITVLRLGRDVGVYERETDHAAGDRGGDHRRDSHQGRGHPGYSAGARVVSSEVDVAAPGIGLPEGDEAETQAGLWRRAYDNLRTGNLGVLPIAIGLVFIVVFFSFKATNFFTADNFNNIIVQMAGLTMLAFGVVFVLLLGEIDLSIGYLSGIAALTVAELQLAGSSHDYPGLIAIVLAVGLCALIGGAQGSIVALVGVPSFVVTLAGLLIWQGVILQVLEIRGVIVIQDKLINDLANYYFTSTAGWIIAAVVTGIYALTMLGSVVGKRRAGVAIRNPLLIVAKVAGVAVATFGVVAISNHANVPKGLPLAGVLVVIFLIGLTYLAKRTPFGRHVYAVGGNAEAARRAGINVARIRIIVFMISGAMCGVGGVILAARLNSVDLNVGGGTLLLDAISAAVIGGTSLFGGRGEVRSALIGALVISTVSNGLNTAGYKTGTIYVVTGVILLLAVTLDTVARRLQVRSGR